jgi:hypothetical protein
MRVSETYRAGAAIVFPRRLPHACPPEAFHIGSQYEWPIASCFPAERSEHFARYAGRDPAEYLRAESGYFDPNSRTEAQETKFAAT